MKSLDNYGTVELNNSEIIEIEGGIFGFDDAVVVAFVAGAVASYVIGEVVDGVVRYACGERVRK